MKAKKAAATKKATKFPRNGDTNAEAEYEQRRLDAEFPKIDLREVLGDEVAHRLLAHAQTIAVSEEVEAYRPCLEFIVRKCVDAELASQINDLSYMVCAVRDYDAHARNLKKGGAR